jgi:hypothetical protein
MPTGYTAAIEDGSISTGKEFLMRCARAFGACIEMRDDSLTKAIPEKFEESSLYKRSLQTAKENLSKYQSLTIEEAELMCRAEYEQSRKSTMKFIEEQERIFESYRKVLEEVKQWNPPTSDHNGLKNFAIEQITMCMKDCDLSYWENKLEAQPKSSELWLAEKIAQAEKDVAYYEKEAREESERVSGRNKWIADLRSSLS